MIIAVDFDGTCVTHEFPKVGKDIGAAPVLRRIVENGHQLILYTMRSNRVVELHDGLKEEHYLSDAIQWFKENNIPLYGIQKNPTQDSWTDSPKVYAQLYIDDAALGCPLKYDSKLSDRPFVDWERVLEYFILNEV